jgi:uncharacterized protein YqeY
MSLEKDVNEALKAAMRDRDQKRLVPIRALRGEIIKMQKNNEDVTDEALVKVIKGHVKQRQDAITMYESHGRAEQAEAEKSEIAVLQEFLPEALTEDELGAMIDAVIAETGAESRKQMGQVMGALRPQIASSGKDADGRLVAELVKARLS